MTDTSAANRVRWSLALVLALVFSQVAQAAYACMGLTRGAAGSHAECMEAGQQHAAGCDASSLCWSHCQQIDQSRDRADPSHGAWAGAPALPLLASFVPAPGGVSIPPEHESARAGLPVRVKYCRLHR